MKCCSRSTFGVVIGCLNILGYVALTTFLITLLIETNATESKSGEQQDTAVLTSILVITIILSLLMCLVSGLLIMGIVKRRHKLMKPWVYVSITGIVLNCVRFVAAFIGSLVSGAPVSTVFTFLIVGALVLGISFLIFWAIYTLYRDIREENNERPVVTVGDGGIPYQLQNK